MRHPPLLFLDTECLGLDINAPIWEVAAIRVVDGAAAVQLDTLVYHEPGKWVATLPTSFQVDYRTRYSDTEADSKTNVITYIDAMAEGVIVVGSNPQFDMQRIEKLADDIGFDGTIGWHYHPIDMPTMIHGYLCGKGVYPTPPWKSDLLSQMVGVDPRDFNRHTALGDALWCKAMWNAVTDES